MTEKEQYNADSGVEREVAKFLDKFVYGAEGNGFASKRVDDREEQLSGVDLIMSCPELGIKEAFVDEKSASSYWNRRISTFAFELSFLRNGKLRTGWLLNDKLKTEYYNACWVNATKRWFKCEDITWLEMAVVKKSKILDYLASQNLTLEHLAADDKWIRSHIKERGRVGAGRYDGCVFYYSPQLYEKPINILIDKKVLLDIAETRIEIGK